MQALAPTFGQLYGTGKFEEIGKEARQEGWLAIFLPLCGFFLSYSQLFFDAIQITSSYILRAYKVVLAPTLLYILTLWCVWWDAAIYSLPDLFHH